MLSLRHHSNSSSRHTINEAVQRWVHRLPHPKVGQEQAVSHPSRRVHHRTNQPPHCHNSVHRNYRNSSKWAAAVVLVVVEWLE